MKGISSYWWFQPKVAGLGHQLTIDLAGLIESVQEVAEEQVAYMVDMAKADALDLLGETRQAFELVERHV